MKKLFIIFLLFFNIFSCQKRDSNVDEQEGRNLSTQVPEYDYPIKPVAFTQVRIDDNFWAPRIKTNREVTIPYTFEKSVETGRISNFAKAGGLETGEFQGIYFNDSDVFKIIEGASYTLQVKDDPELKGYLDDLINKIAAAQEEDGYLYTNRTIDPEKAHDEAGEQRWTKLVSHHELYNAGHMYEAAVAHYQATRERTFLDVAIKNANLVAEEFGPGKNMGVPGHQEIEIGLVKLYRVTGDEKYLDLAKFFVDQRGNQEGHELFGFYSQDHKPFIDQEKAVGHAVRACYYYAGVADVATLTGNSTYNKALNTIWEDIVYRKIYLTGGIGAEPKHEGFGPDYELPNATAYTETCAAISLMLWNHRMFLRNGEVKYMDVFERTLYNGFLAGISLEGNTFFYPNPLEANGIYTFNHGSCERSPWFDCSCCPVNVVRILPSLPGYIYAVKDRNVYINLYIGNSADIDLGDEILDLSQKTNYPWDGIVQINVNNTLQSEFAIKLRVPGWVRNEVMPGELYKYIDNKEPSWTILLNGKEVSAEFEKGYVTLGKRKWEKGDQIEILFDMPVRKIMTNEKVEENRGKIAFERGPLVYCAEEVDNQAGVLNHTVDKDENFEFEFDSQLLNGIGKIKSKELTIIPYYAWNHRGVGEMVVWLKNE